MRFASDCPDHTLTPAFAALVPLVEERTGMTVVVSGQSEWMSDGREIIVPQNDVEGLLHELCHYVMAPPKLRHRTNYGLGISEKCGPNDSPADMQQERFCGWVEDYLYRKARLVRPASSVDKSAYQQHPRLRPNALRRWRKGVTPEHTRAIVRALQLPGGGATDWVGLHPGE